MPAGLFRIKASKYWEWGGFIASRFGYWLWYTLIVRVCEKKGHGVGKSHQKYSKIMLFSLDMACRLKDTVLRCSWSPPISEEDNIKGKKGKDVRSQFQSDGQSIFAQ